MPDSMRSAARYAVSLVVLAASHEMPRLLMRHLGRTLSPLEFVNLANASAILVFWVVAIACEVADQLRQGPQGKGNGRWAWLHKVGVPCARSGPLLICAWCVVTSTSCGLGVLTVPSSSWPCPSSRITCRCG